MRFRHPVLENPAIQSNFEQLEDLILPSTVAALPPNPFDGQEIFYLADAAKGLVWHFKYRAASASAYKWEFVGGSELASYTGGSAETVYPAGETRARPVGVEPKVTLPLAGDYVIHPRFTMVWREKANAQVYATVLKENTEELPGREGGLGFTNVGNVAGTQLYGMIETINTYYNQVANTKAYLGAVIGTGGETKLQFFEPAIFARPIRVG